jgi:hypothetical protein
VLWIPCLLAGHVGSASGAHLSVPGGRHRRPGWPSGRTCSCDNASPAGSSASSYEVGVEHSGEGAPSERNDLGVAVTGERHVVAASNLRCAPSWPDPRPDEGHPTVGLKKLRARGGEPWGAEEHPGTVDDGRILPSAAAPNAIAGAPPGFSRRRVRASGAETRGRPSSRFEPEGAASHHGAWRRAGEPTAATQAAGEVQPASCYLCRLGDLHWAPPSPSALAHNALHRL